MACESIVSGPFHARVPLGMIHADDRTGLRFWLTFSLRSHDDFLTDSIRRPVSVAIVFFAFALPAVRVPPVIDGVIGPNEWADARRERMTHGSEVLLLRFGGQLYVGAVGSARGYPSAPGKTCPRRQVIAMASRTSTATKRSRGVSISFDPTELEWVDRLVSALEREGYAFAARSEVIRVGLIQLREALRDLTPSETVMYFARRHAARVVAAAAGSQSRPPSGHDRDAGS